MHTHLLGGRPVHFPFLSGILRYRCEDCDAPCCKGTALGIGKSRELVTLQKVQPAIGLFSTPGYHGTPLLSLSAPKEACWFLDKKSRCRLETVIGRPAKPSGCRLFPFQRMRTMGETIAVLPDFLCPIEIARHPSDEGPTSHDELCLEMHRTQVPPRGHLDLPAPRDVSWKRAVDLERRVVAESGAHLEARSYIPFAEVQAALTYVATDAEMEAGHLGRLDHTIRAFIGAEESTEALTVHDLVALTGVLRLMVSSLPRSEMPGLLVALSVLLDVYAGMRGVKRGPRTIISLFEQRLPLLYVLSHLLDRPQLKPNFDARRLIAPIPAVRAPLLRVLQAVVENRKRHRTLLEILEGASDTFSPPLSVEVVAMLFGLGKALLQAGAFSSGVESEETVV